MTDVATGHSPCEPALGPTAMPACASHADRPQYPQIQGGMTYAPLVPLMPSPFKTHESTVQIFGEPVNGYLFFYISYYPEHVKLDSHFFKSLSQIITARGGRLFY